MLDQLKQRLGDWAERYVESISDPLLRKRLETLQANLNEYGVDPFGFDPQMVKYAAPFVHFFYRHYFRVETHDIERVPPGRLLLIGNHSGQIPVDAAMIISAMLMDAVPPRMVRSMVETWVPSLPVLSYLFPRWGQIVGTRENCRRLLEMEEAILAFPEGVRGINKPFSKRYQLQEFGLGFMRLALMTGAPIVPVAVIGAEEQTINLYNAKSMGKYLGMPGMPITPSMPLLGPLAMLPLPTKYRIYFGRPLRFSGDPDDEDSVVQKMVNRVRGAVSRMLHDGLKAREHVFW